MTKDKNNVDLMYDHYKETCASNRKVIEVRNKTFVLLCILQSLSFLFAFNCKKAYELVLQAISAKAGESLIVGQGIVQTLLWILTLYVFIRYIQSNINVERQYGYLSEVEKDLIKCGLNINREGDYYNSNYPKILKIIDFLYKWAFPILFLIIDIVRIVVEWKYSLFNVALLIDTVAAITIIYLISNYLYALHSDK